MVLRGKLYQNSFQNQSRNIHTLLNRGGPHEELYLIIFNLMFVNAHSLFEYVGLCTHILLIENKAIN
jgi:hypothetical protein